VGNEYNRIKIQQQILIYNLSILLPKQQIQHDGQRFLAEELLELYEACFFSSQVIILVDLFSCARHQHNPSLNESIFYRADHDRKLNELVCNERRLCLHVSHVVYHPFGPTMSKIEEICTSKSPSPSSTFSVSD
jgi:hypothetical protein